MNRIAVVRSVFLPISETFIYNEILHMKRYKPYIYCDKRKNKSLFPVENLIVDPGYHQLTQTQRKDPFQLIHARFATTGIKILKKKEQWNIPLVTSFHGCNSPGTMKMKKRRKSLHSLFSIGDRFTVPCIAMKHELIKHGCPEEKIIVHYSGIDIEHFKYKERVFPAEGPVRIVFVGKLVEKKGAELLIRAFLQVQRAFPHTQLSLIGEGPLKNKLRRLRKKLNLEQYVEFRGALSHHEVAHELEKAHLFCLPIMKDRTVGIPNAIKEAMAYGLPVVSTVHSGIPELIEDGKTGHLVAEDDVNLLANKLIELVGQPGTWKQLGLRARQKIKKDFNLREQTDKLEQLFDQEIKTYEKKAREKPFFSIVIPTYNRARFIKRAIKSVLRQTCTDYEIIVVDDGSKDQTSKVVQSFGPAVRYVYQRNKGPSIARNTGIQLAKGKFIAFLDSDDVFLPNKLEQNKQYLENHSGCHFLYSWYYSVRRGGRKRKVDNARGYKNLNTFRKKILRRKFTIRTSTAVIHRSCFDKVGGFDRRYRYSQDWDMWLRLARHYPAYCQNKALVKYRKHYRKKKSPSTKRHTQIRVNALKLYQWDRPTIRHLMSKHYKRRTHT